VLQPRRLDAASGSAMVLQTRQTFVDSAQQPDMLQRVSANVMVCVLMYPDEPDTSLCKRTSGTECTYFHPLLLPNKRTMRSQMLRNKAPTPLCYSGNPAES
jgi:hypothetical protein